MLAYLDYMIGIAIISGIIAGYGYIRLYNYERQVIFTNKDIKHIKRLEKYVIFSWVLITVMTFIIIGYLIYQYAGLPRYGIIH